MKKLILILSVLFVISEKGKTQEYNLGFGFTPKVGFLAVHHKGSMTHLVNDQVYGVNLSLALQTKGNKTWHHDFNLPELSVNLYYLSIANQSILGNAIGTEVGIYLPFFRVKGWSLGADLAAGLAFTTKRYDVVTNPKNNAIGSHLNSSVSLGVKVVKQWERHSLGVGVGAKHISNGAAKLPNLGLNMPFLNLHYTHFFRKVESDSIPSEDLVIHPVKTWRFYTELIASTKQIYPTGGRNYGIMALSGYAHYKFNRKFILEGGIDLSYNQSLVEEVAGEWDRVKNIQSGVYAAFVLPIHRFQLYAGMGTYIISPLSPNGRLYHRLGGRFKIVNRLWANISIKSHWGKADYFEYGIAYRW